MKNAYVLSLLALSPEHCGSWEISRLLDYGTNISVKEIGQLTKEWNRIPTASRHQLRLRLRSESPADFARAAVRLSGPGHVLSSRLRCAVYQPDLWSEMDEVLPFIHEYSGLNWVEEFGQADDDFLASLPEPLYLAMLTELSDSWWQSGSWTRKRLENAVRFGVGRVGLQVAMLSGDSETVSRLLGAEERRAGYGVVWEFLQGKQQEAYLALKKLIARRREHIPVFSGWVALWTRLIALSQGDQGLFDDRRLGGDLTITNAFEDVSLKFRPSKDEFELSCGLLHAALWIARDHHRCTLVLPSSVLAYWDELELPLLRGQLHEKPSTPLLPKSEHEEPWQTFLRLLNTQSEILQKSVPVGGGARSSGATKSGALLWHLYPPEIIFYNDKSANHDLGPDQLGGKAVNSKTLFSRMPNYLNDADRLAMGKVRLSYYGSALLNAEVLRLLMDHPRVYCNSRRVKLQELVQRLRIENDGSGLRLKMWPEIPPDRDYLLQEDGRFWTRSPLEKHLQPLLRDHEAIPVSAERELREAVSKWADRIEVEVGEGLAPLRQAELKVDLLVLRARPYSRGMRFEWLVRSSGHPDYHRPAFEGRERERFEDGSTAALITRDFVWEQQQHETYLTSCPSMPASASFRLDSLPEVLELLQECQAANIVLEWPEGQAWRVRRAEEMSVTVRQAVESDWFSLEGGLQLERGESLDLQSALSAARLSQGSFLQLGENDFVRVQAELREQLEALADLSDSEEPRIPALAVPSLAELELSGFNSDAAFQERLESFQECAHYVAAVPRRLEAELRDYQLEGFRWLARHARMGTGACLADDMGLGKTLQAIALMLSLRAEGPHLVVCPLSVLAQWEQQIEQFAPTLRATQNRELKGLKAGDVVLCSYGVLLRDIKKLSKIRWSVAVLDEAQAIKNPQSKTARSAYQLQARVRVATTGTPIENRLSELWSLFAFLNPGLLGTLAAFRRRYEQAGVGRSRLRRLIAPFVLRRLKSQVLSELPPRTEVTLKVALSESELELYEKLREDAQRDVEDGQNFELLAHLTRLRQACCHPRLLLPESEFTSSKLETLMELVEQLSEGHHRALVFSQFTRFLDLAQEQFEQRGVAYQRLDGSTSAAERKRRVAAFQEGEGEVFLISLKAGGTGLNLTGADYVIHLDPWWNPAAEDQASDRVHRIGQRRPVTVYRLVAEHTLEEKVVRLHGHKRELAKSVLEGNEHASPLSVEELRELLRMA